MRRWPVVVAVVVVALALAAAGFLLGRATSVPPAEGVDAGFARDMQTHHRQAVEMSFIIRDKSDAEDIQTLTYDMINGQAHQAGQMWGWLAAWGHSQNSAEPPMEWMLEFGHEHGQTADDAMAAMGMATPEQIDALEEASGVAAERMYLELMIVHHKGAIDMADLAVEHATRPEVRTLAGAIKTAQVAEVGLLEDMLARR